MIGSELHQEMMDADEGEEMSLSEFTLNIRTDNAAFFDEDSGRESVEEISRILRKVADRLDQGDWYEGHTRSILDINGNRVGGYKWA